MAWLTLDSEDDARTLAAYLSFAFSEAGLEIQGSRATSSDFEHGDYRINLLIHSIEASRTPCVLALDDVHQVRDPESLALINRLIQSGPPNLHLALAFRELPGRLDLATPLLEGRGDTITVDQLRFDKPDIARFFETQLSRRELNELNEVSRGWPIALCMHRNAARRDDSAMPELAMNWIEASLWRGLSPDDREFVLDVGLLDWIDADLVAAVLPAGAMRRIKTMPALTGLLQTVGAAPDLMRLHPLIRQYCAERRFRETPERYRAIHRATAKAVAGMGKVVVAVRHAVEAHDPQLVGEIVEQAGGFQIWLLEGMTRLRSVEKMLTGQVLDMFPRLGLLRCIGLIAAGQFDATREMYAELHARTDGFSRDRDGGSDVGLRVDDVAYRFLLASCGCQPFAGPGIDALATSIRDLTKDRGVDPFVRGIAKHAIGEIELARANLATANDWFTRARTELVRRSAYMTMHVDWRLGTLALLEGRPADAAHAYARAQRAAKEGFLREAGPTVISDVLATELGLERNRIGSPTRRPHKLPELLAESGAWLDVFAAAAETTIQLALQEGGPDRALGELEPMIEFAKLTERATWTRCLSAWRVSLLVAAGRIEEAQELSSAELPQDIRTVVDLDNQTWREMEAISCAALRLLTARREFESAREIADALLAVCADRGLKRTRMRGLVLAMVLEHRAGNPSEARARLVDYLDLFADTDYARPLVQERETGLAVLNGLENADIETRLHNIVASLRGTLEDQPRRRDTDAVPTFTARERDILQRLDRWRDKEIAAALHLSEDGVRYHVKKIFRKLGVRSRFEATRRARSLGILPDSEGSES